MEFTLLMETEIKVWITQVFNKQLILLELDFFIQEYLDEHNKQINDYNSQTKTVINGQRIL